MMEICKIYCNIQKFTFYYFQKPSSCFTSSRSLKCVALLYERSVLNLPPKNKINRDLNFRNVTVLFCSVLFYCTLHY